MAVGDPPAPLHLVYPKWVSRGEPLGSAACPLTPWAVPANSAAAPTRATRVQFAWTEPVLGPVLPSAWPWPFPCGTNRTGSKVSNCQRVVVRPRLSRGPTAEAQGESIETRYGIGDPESAIWQRLLVQYINAVDASMAAAACSASRRRACAHGPLTPCRWCYGCCCCCRTT